MPATARSRRRKRVRKAQINTLSLPDQVALAFRSGSRIAAILGALFGGSVPIAVYVLVHYEVQARPWLWAFVVAGLMFSFLSVYLWARQAFQHSGRLLTHCKSVAFALILEGVTSFSHTQWLSMGCLSILTFVNAVSSAVCVQAIE
jgi:hypothetical protein